jgi:hypothetical protein
MISHSTPPFLAFARKSPFSQDTCSERFLLNCFVRLFRHTSQRVKINGGCENGRPDNARRHRLPLVQPRTILRYLPDIISSAPKSNRVISRLDGSTFYPASPREATSLPRTIAKSSGLSVTALSVPLDVFKLSMNSHLPIAEHPPQSELLLPFCQKIFQGHLSSS